MKKGEFYSIGVGPGDPSLMTFKAAETIRKCDVIISPDSGGKESVALGIAAEYIKGKRVEICPMPMTKDEKTLGESHDAAAARIAKLLDDGLSAAFLTLGDPAVYSTAMYVHRRLKEMGYATAMIPGVTSFCAAAAALDVALCEGAEPMHIIPASYGGGYQELDGTKILMKSGRARDAVLSGLKNRADSEVFMVRRASMPDEAVFRSIDEIDGDTDYFSIFVVKHNARTAGQSPACAAVSLPGNMEKHK